MKMNLIATLMVASAAAVLLGLGLALSLNCVPPFGEVVFLVGLWLARTARGMWS